LKKQISTKMPQRPAAMAITITIAGAFVLATYIPSGYVYFDGLHDGRRTCLNWLPGGLAAGPEKVAPLSSNLSPPIS
jgi:hypothetical protein